MKYLLMLLMLVATSTWSMTPEELQEKGKAVEMGRCAVEDVLMLCQKWQVGKDEYSIVFVRYKGKIIPAAIYKMNGDEGELVWLNPVLDTSI